MTNAKSILDNIIEELFLNRGAYLENPEKDFTRTRKLDFTNTVKLILSMKGNTLNKELYDFFGKDPEKIATSSAFIQQRGKIQSQFFIDLFHQFNESMTEYNSRTYNGYKLYAVDGSDINIAYDNMAETYVKPQKIRRKQRKKGIIPSIIPSFTKGYNQYHLNAIYDLLNRVYINANLAPKPKANERKSFLEMFDAMTFDTKTLFICDRGYPSWNLFAHIQQKENADYLIRIKNNENTLASDLPMTELDVDKRIVVTTDRKNIGRDGYKFVQVTKGNQVNRKYIEDAYKQTWDFDDDLELNIRIVRFKISDDTYETIFTSLPRDKFDIQQIKELYHMRWGIETSFRELKYVIGLTNMHAKKDCFIQQEIFAKLIMYNFAEQIISSAVVKQDNDRKFKYQINYTMGIQICLDFYRCLVDASKVYELMLKYILPIREGRRDVRKMKPKSFVCFTYRVAA